MNLSEILTKARFEIQEGLLFVASGSKMNELGEVFENLSESFQALSICYLLQNDNQARFQENLIRSGHARRFYLRKSHEEGNIHDRHLALGRCSGFLDSVAAGHLLLARNIADLSINQWESNWEYEDDYCFFHFLNTFLKTSPNIAQEVLKEIIINFERSLEGELSTRFDICNALLARNAGDFEEALIELLDEQHEQNEKDRLLLVESDSLSWPRLFISVEGLALLKIAEVMGIELHQDFILCPEIARLPTTDREYVDIFQQIERELAKGTSPSVKV
jgi:hypothetical protein